MRPTDIADLFDHLYWMRDRILAAADAPGVPLTTDAHATIRDLRATLVHELDVEWSWRVRLASPDPTEFSAEDEELAPTDFETLDEIRSRWADDEREMRRLARDARRRRRSTRRAAPSAMPRTRSGCTSSTCTRTRSSSSATARCR